MDQKVKSVPAKSSDDYVKGMAIYDTEEVSWKSEEQKPIWPASKEDFKAKAEKTQLEIKTEEKKEIPKEEPKKDEVVSPSKNQPKMTAPSNQGGMKSAPPA